MTRKYELEELAERVRIELERDAKELARRMFGKGMPDAVKLPREQFIDYVRRHWAEPEFRQKLLDMQGPRNFLKVAEEVLGASIEPQGPSEEVIDNA